MIRLIAASVLVVAALIPQSVPAVGPVDLDAPGALDALQRSNPVHYEKVVKILDSVRNQPEANIARWLRVAFDAQDVSYPPITLTSHPAQRRLSFALDATRYVAVIVLTNLRGEIVPLR